VVLGTALALSVLAVNPKAVHAAPDKVAVLGLEVIDDGSNGASVKKTTDVAKLVTDQLREQANSKATTLRLAPNSDKDLLELKLLSDCSDENSQCMGQIGRELRANQMVYGKLERRRTGYWVGLTLFDVAQKRIVRKTELVIPFRAAQPGAVTPHAEKLFRTIVGMSAGATLSVRVTNSKEGTVYLDGRSRGSLVDGALSIVGVAEGSHTLRVLAKGFRPRQQQVQVRANENVSLDVVLFDDILATTPENSHEDRSDGRTGAKIAFWSATAGTIAAGGLWTFSGLQVLSARDDRDAAVDSLSATVVEGGQRVPVYPEYVAKKGELNNDDCDTADALAGGGGVDQDLVSMLQDACSKGKTHSLIATWIAPPATAILAATAIYFGYRAYIKDGPDEADDPEAKVSFEPYAGPNVVGAGMTVRF